MKLKTVLKIIKLNESTISMVLGVIVVIISGGLIIKFVKQDKGSIPQELLNGSNSIESTSKIHKVAKGENLWNIAVKYYGDGFKWVDIATENKIENASVIEMGQDLVIPNVESDADNLDPIASDTYEIVKGDTLWSIAVRAYGDGYQWSKIAKENNLSHPNIIHSGNILQIPK